MSNCNHNCSECGEQGCQERIVKINPHKGTSINKIIGILSAKGGVGKSLLTTLLAISKKRENKEVGILDADITGPSIPKSFNLKSSLYADNGAILPLVSKSGIKIVSASSLLDSNEEPILWRGPLVANMVKQFFTDTNFGKLDYLFIDMPPGTSDVSLTVFQSIPIDGIIIVTTPQELVNEIVAKAINMANKMNVPIIGIVENMSYLECPKCKEKISIFGHSHIEEIANKYGIKILGRIPINPKISELIDNGHIEEIKDTYINL